MSEQSQPSPEFDYLPHHTAYELFKRATEILVERGEAYGDRIQYDFDIDTNRRVILHNYATSAAHAIHNYDMNDPNQFNSLQNSESILTAIVHDTSEDTTMSYVICRPMDVSRNTIFSLTLGEQLLDSLEQDKYTILTTELVGRAQVIELSPDRLYDLLQYIK